MRLPSSPVLGALAIGVLVALAPRPSAADLPPHPNGIVLHVGDSFVDAGLRQTLGPKFSAEKTVYLAFSQTSSYIASWAGSVRLNELYWGYHPSLVLVTLGANDVGTSAAPRIPYVKRLVRELHGTPCVWLLVPLWKGASPDVNEMIKREAAPCRVFDPSAIADQIARQDFDGKHPSKEGGAFWAEEFWKWLLRERDPNGARGYWSLKPAEAP